MPSPVMLMQGASAMGAPMPVAQLPTSMMMPQVYGAGPIPGATPPGMSYQMMSVGRP